MELNWIEWYGYLASLVVFISLMMSSIIKLRVFNFIGCLIFAHYGFLTGLLPVSVANLSIALINVYYLYQIYKTKEQFKLVNAEVDSAYYQHFLAINQNEITKQVSLQELTEVNTSFYMLRDDNIAGILAGFKELDGTFTIYVDYVPPKYRDYKLGAYYYNQHPEFLIEKGIRQLKTYATDKDHCFYLEKMGFVNENSDDKQLYKKTL
ncbi:MAG: YgjV family protein [Psychromonas sp.]|nr:YgjV family protein [Alteromonadales bacterium]MCP5076605.1 YgjV family protein [Psychromonas sp.]